VTGALLTLTLLTLGVTGNGALEATLRPEERALLDELDKEKLIKARDDAEHILATDKSSFAATWAMVRVHHDEEGNHARALFYLTRAEALLGDRDADWGKKLLLEEYFILQEMNRNAEAIEALDRYAKRYQEPPSGLRIWPLFKLGRNAEARAIATRLAASDEWQERADGYNGLLSIAFEEHDREGTYKWAIAGVKATQGESCTLLRNAGSSAFTRFHLDESEELLLRAGKKRDCLDPVDNQLASLYIVEGEFQKALAALKSARGQPIEKRYRPQFALVRRTVLADLLVALGKGAEAAKLAADLYGQQTRTGMTSSAANVERLSRALRYAFALDGQLTLLEEQASYAALPAGPAAFASQMSTVVARRWEIRRVLVQLLAEDDRLSLLARPNIGELSDWSNWRVGDLTEIVGVGVLRSAIARARTADEGFPEATSYLDALEGEVAFRDAQLEKAERLGKLALDKLPRQEALMRWRTEAWYADTLRRLGRSSEARAHYQLVLQRWPTAFRLLALKVPVAVATDGTALALATSKRLSRSIRFAVAGEAPFRLRVESGTAGLSICLSDDSGAQFACASGKDADAALEAFHGEAFSPRISLTQSDLRSLDGSTSRVGADQALKEVLGQ
jgi:hypothetical protein